MKNYMVITVHAGKGKFEEVMVSPEDYIHYSQWKGWQLNHPKGYAGRTIRKPEDKSKFRIVYMHRLIANAPDGVEVDHINGDRLDNRRENLRLSNRSNNLLNKRVASSKSTTGYIGVEVHRDKFTARINIMGKRTYIGTFNTASEASNAYQQYKIDNVTSYREAIEMQLING